MLKEAYLAGVKLAVQQKTKKPKIDPGVDVATRMGTGLLGAGLGSGLGGIVSQGIEDDRLRALAQGGTTLAGAGLGAYAPNLAAGVGGALGVGTLGEMGGEALGRALAKRYGWDETHAGDVGSNVGMIGGALGGGMLGEGLMRALRRE